MRITFLTPAADMSGGARVIHIYAARLARRGHMVTVITRPPAHPVLRHRISNVIRGKSVSSAPRPTHYQSGPYDLLTIDSARPIEARDVPDADVVIATWWESVEWMMRLPPSKGRPLHFVQHYEAFDNMPKERVDAVLSLPLRRITISTWLDEILRNRFGQQWVALVRNSVDTQQFYAPVRSRADRPTVGMLYSDVAWKDFPTGFAAFELLRERLPEARLITFGNKPLPEHYTSLQGSTHTVLPAQDVIREIYSSCDVWLCSSVAEGFYLPLLEAMACRCPVISTPVGGPADIIREGENGYLTPIGDSFTMAERLRQFFARPEDQWRAMSTAAHDTAVGYSWDDATDLFEAAVQAE